MSKPLTKYSKPKDLTQTTRVDKALDIHGPFSFSEWQSRNVGIIPGKEFILYSLYLKEWYRKQLTKAPSSSITKQQYKDLLRELAVVFRDDIQKNVWLTRVDWDNDWELETIIPFFARKLKEVALYLANKRDVIKQAKLKYNMVGAVQALEKLLYNYFLNAFTRTRTTLGVSDLSAWNRFPELSAIRKDFSLEVEELFDEEEYFDKNPAVNPRVYFDLANSKNTQYYRALNFPLSALNWLYKAGFAPTSANNLLTWTLSGALSAAGLTSLDSVPISSFEMADNQRPNIYNLFDLSNTYLGEIQWIASGGYYIPQIKTYTYDLVQGNNWFYWPSGEYFNEAEIDTTIEPIPLSATNFTLLGTAGSDYRDSDVIFVNKNDVVTGAWLKQIDYTTMLPIMSAILESGAKTTFKFPWPGVGLSGDDMPWSGKSLSNFDKTFDYLNDDYKKAIINAYWDDIDDIHKITPLLLNDTKLVDVGATAASNYIEADKITIRPSTVDSAHDENPDSIYTSAQQYAWLYKFDTTQIPIASGVNQILWPLQRLDTVTNLPSAFLPTTCNNTLLASLSVHNVFPGSTAGTALSVADIITKQSAFGSTITEFAWLCGMPTSAFNAFTGTVSAGSLFDGAIQAGYLNFTVEAGNYVTFLWTGPDGSDVNDYIHWHDHSNDCPYKVLNQKLKPLSRDISNLNVDIGSLRWDLCTCKAFYYSPFGHAGSYIQYYGIHDFICEDFNYPAPFDIEAWRDGALKYNASPKFAWYNTTSADMGYNPGAFHKMDNSGNNFYLRKGHIYRYYRSNLKRDATNFSVPYLVVRQPSTDTTTPAPSDALYFPQWAKATPQADGTWVSTGSKTDMTIRPGDILSYYHHNPERQIDAYTYQERGINFLLAAPLSGWNYVTNLPDTTARGARPFWAYAGDEASATVSKGTPVYGNTIQIVDDYVQYTQPSASNIFLSNDLYFEYERVGTALIWIQQVEMFIYVDKQQWKKLLFDTKVAPLLEAGLQNTLSLSATQDPSDLLLEPVAALKPVLVNYFAQKPFTFTQDLSDTTLGVPPTGGLWVSPISSTYVIPSQPYANLTNRHFPTVAVVPNLARCQSMSDTGGYFTPKGLGALTYLGKHFTTRWDTPEVRRSIEQRIQLSDLEAAQETTEPPQPPEWHIPDQ